MAFSRNIEIWLTAVLIGILFLAVLPQWHTGSIRKDVALAHARLAATSKAMEGYRLDYAQFPENEVNGGYIWLYVPNRLTSPIAYVTNLDDINDPFKSQLADEDFPIGVEYANRMTYASRSMIVGWNGVNLPLLQPDFYPFGFWSSYGPDMEFGPMRPIRGYQYPIIPQYDPSNGTFSDGDIIRTPGGRDMNGWHLN